MKTMTNTSEAMSKSVPGSNGMLRIQLPWWGFWQHLEFHGGPYTNVPSGAFGVCLREHLPSKTTNVWLPIDDFSVPKDIEATEEALKKTLQASLEGKVVYVGCMGGWGRTGLFLSLIAKACGEPQPVFYVRKHYTEKAVETPEQGDFVKNFDVSGIQWWLMWRTFWHVCVGRFM
jgi:hypothetical protein